MDDQYMVLLSDTHIVRTPSPSHSLLVSRLDEIDG